MRILLLINNLGAGGKERRLLELIKGVKRYQNTNMHLVVFSEDIHYQEVFDLDIPITIIKRVPKYNPMVLIKLYNLCKKWKPDVMHSWSSLTTLLAIPISMLLSKKLIIGNITDVPEGKMWDRRLVRAKLTFPFSEVIVGNSLAGLEAYKVPKKKAVCIYNGFDIGRLSCLEDKLVIRKKLNIQTDKVVGMVGSFNGNKDYDTFITAASILSKERNDVTFVAVGAGSELENYKEKVAAQNLPRFVFTGLQTDVESIVNVFNIGVLSTYTEGISNALLEYMALAKPSIASIGGGTTETIADKKTGYLIPKRSPEILAEKINYVLNNPKEAKQMGQAGRDRLENTFDLERMTQAYYKLYHKVKMSY